MTIPRPYRKSKRDESYVLVGGEVLVHVHPRSKCAGENCVIHNPSNHHMRHWRQHWRSDRYMMERICEHGVGHPDPDDPTTDTIHGCDGCCWSGRAHVDAPDGTAKL